MSLERARRIIAQRTGGTVPPQQEKPREQPADKGREW